MICMMHRAANSIQSYVVWAEAMEIMVHTAFIMFKCAMSLNEFCCEFCVVERRAREQSLSAMPLLKELEFISSPLDDLHFT